MFLFHYTVFEHMQMEKTEKSLKWTQSNLQGLAIHHEHIENKQEQTILVIFYLCILLLSYEIHYML
jgi:hypothetical protein